MIDELPVPSSDPPRVTKDVRKLERVKNHPGIYRRGKRYVVVGYDNRGRQVKRSTPNLTVARQVQAELRADVGRGEYRRRSQEQFVDYAQKTVDGYRGRTSRGFKPQTLKDYKAALSRTEFVEHFSGLRLSEVEADDLKGYATVLENAGLSPRTIRNLLLPIRIVLAEATAAGHIRSNPAFGLRLVATMGVGKRQKDARALTDDELDRFLKALADAPQPYRLLFEFLLQTGLRIGEARALTWEDITLDSDPAVVQVNKRLYKGTTDKPKSDRGERTVPIAPAMVAQLRDLLRAEPQGDGARPVFASSSGAPVDYYAARRVFKEVAVAAAVPWATPHTCRHTCASWLLRSKERGGLGANPKQAQIWLGHHSPAFTMATYVHLMPEDLPNPVGLGRLAADGAMDGATRKSETNRKSPRGSSRQSG